MARVKKSTKTKLLVSMAIGMLFSFVCYLPTASAYSSSWTPNFDEVSGKGTVNFMNLSNWDFELWMYDYDGTGELQIRSTQYCIEPVTKMIGDMNTVNFAGGQSIRLSIDPTLDEEVPILPSAFLLGSGVIGLIGFGLRRRRNRVSLGPLQALSSGMTDRGRSFTRWFITAQRLGRARAPQYVDTGIRHIWFHRTHAES